jgi:hypothetical protein
MTINLAVLLPKLDALTPDGRWRLLQQWIEERPELRALIERWLGMAPEEVFPELREVAAGIAEKEYGALGGALVRTAELTPEAWAWISILQTCYRDRKEQDTEAKHVRKKRRAKL